MISTHEDKSVSQLLDELVIPLKEQKDGVFFIATSDNNSCRFAIQSGKITHCTFKRLHGTEAVQAFQSIESGRCSFSDSMRLPFRPKDSVEHAQALKLLNLQDRLQATTESATAGSTSNNSGKKRYYRGMLIEDESPAAQPPPKKRFYRGSVIEEEKPPPPTKKKRYYRGNVIED